MLSGVMHKHKAVFISISSLNDLSAEQVVTGNVHLTTALCGDPCHVL